APSSRGFIASFRTAEDALLLQKMIADSPLSLASVELVSPQLLQQFLDAEKNSPEPPTAPVAGKVLANSWHLCLSVEGTPEVCERGAGDLKRLVNQLTSKNCQFTELGENEAAEFWHYIGQAIPL